MKKFVSFLIIILIIITLSPAMTGCSGESSKDVTGIYGLERMFYKYVVGSSVDETYNFAGKYDYYILVMYNDNTGKVIIKPEEGEESSYSVTYTVAYKEDEPDVVKSVCVSGFLQPQYELVDDAPVLTFTETEETTFIFVPIINELTYRKYDVSDLINTGTKTTNLLEFTRFTMKTTDKQIEKAKSRQIERKDVRNSNIKHPV